MKLKESVPVRLAVVDWLAFTVPCKDRPTQTGIIDFWGEYFGGAINREQGGAYFYDQGQRVLGSGLLLWHSERVDMGVHISLPASALAKLDVSVLEFMAMVEGFGASWSRVDVAIDTDKVHVQDVLESIEAGELVSKSQLRMLVRKIGEPGMTIYIGSAASERRVRIYDKAAEQDVDGVWTRCEVQLRKDHAQTAAKELLRGCQAVDIIASSLDFRHVTEDSNVTRRLQCEWWAEWLTFSAGGVSFSIEHLDATVEGMRNWIETQVAPTLAFLTAAVGGDTEWVMGVVSAGYAKLQDWQLDRARRLATMG